MTQTISIRHATVYIEGAHRTGKDSLGSALFDLRHKTDTVKCRGFISSWAFSRVFVRPEIDLAQAVEDYFANPAAFLVHIALGKDDYEAERALDSHRKAAAGYGTAYANTYLANLTEFAVSFARQGYSDRVFTLQARRESPEVQASLISAQIDSALAKL